MTTFTEKLDRGWSVSGSMLCVGLDPILERIPEPFASSPRPILAFNRHVVDLVGNLACAFKPQAAHHGAVGAEEDLAETIAYIHEAAPHAVVILDAKRGDIGSTAQMYAREAFERYAADAVTVNPYLGDEGLAPFLEWADRGVVVLCRTSNPGAALIQHAMIGDEPLYLAIARRAQSHWNAHGNVMLVVGATNPDELAQVRRVAPDLPFLVPGVGEQGGDARTVVRSGARKDGAGLLVSASRAILYPAAGETIRSVAERLHGELLTPRVEA
ncbi:MAG: orotidine-5'-phosphate decarboxylase [Caulobacteraceae bacterium]|nr:orotidine-5'-phosphate decarboxylase [Caulobacteraceae bacterium]